MKFTYDHDYHIHSFLSSCSEDPQQTKDNILEYAKKNGLKSICITDHYWDSEVPGVSKWYAPQNFDHISQVKPLPEAEGIEFLFGCETDMDKFLTVGLPEWRFDDFDFVIIPTTHLHMKNFTITAEDQASNERIAELWVERFDRLLDMDLPFHKIGIAHLACSLINRRSREDYLATLRLISDSDMEKVFTKAARVGCGIELNQDDMKFSDAEADDVLRMFRIAKKCGCKFYLGSDAHGLKAFARTKEIFERAIDLLGLTEDDKFHIGG